MPRLLVPVLELAALAVVLVLRFAHEEAIWQILPGRDVAREVRVLVDDGFNTISSYAPPAPVTPGLVFLLAGVHRRGGRRRRHDRGDLPLPRPRRPPAARPLRRPGLGRRQRGLVAVLRHRCGRLARAAPGRRSRTTRRLGAAPRYPDLRRRPDGQRRAGRPRAARRGRPSDRHRLGRPRRRHPGRRPRARRSGVRSRPRQRERRRWGHGQHHQPLRLPRRRTCIRPDDNELFTYTLEGSISPDYLRLVSRSTPSTASTGSRPACRRRGTWTATRCPTPRGWTRRLRRPR